MTKPETKEQAYEHGYNSHNEGMCPFRNTGIEDVDLYASWMKGFEKRKEENEL